MYRVLLSCPQSTPKAALLWDFGSLKIKFRIMKIKLNFFHHILSDKTALAYQVQEVQEKLCLPGLTQECLKYMEDLGLPNILEEKMSMLSWKKKSKKGHKECK